MCDNSFFFWQYIQDVQKVTHLIYWNNSNSCIGGIVSDAYTCMCEIRYRFKSEGISSENQRKILTSVDPSTCKSATCAVTNIYITTCREGRLKFNGTFIPAFLYLFHAFILFPVFSPYSFLSSPSSFLSLISFTLEQWIQSLHICQMTPFLNPLTVYMWRLQILGPLIMIHTIL
jgi:hypothetical protein